MNPGVFLLTAVCGVIDATCFLALGAVFAEIMTGNIMFLAFEIGQTGGLAEVPYYGVPLVFFSTGALASGYVLQTQRLSGARRHAFVLVAALIALAFFLALVLQPSGRSLDSIIIVAILALAMGMQNAAVLYHRVTDIATNVMTLTLVRLLSNWSVVGGDNARWSYRLGSISIFFVAAAMGAFLVRYGPAVGLGCALLLYVIALPFLLRGRSPAETPVAESS
jgi:uncharacterized membrane protein YoaK (UPF0700 family)